MLRKNGTRIIVALGAFCLLLLVALQYYQAKNKASPSTTTPTESAKLTANAVHKTLYEAVPGKWRRTLREVAQGRAVAYMWSHRIWISPCRWSKRKTLRANTEEDSHQVFKCGGMKVEIVNEELRVNEKSYGKLSKGVDISVANGRVFIGYEEAQPLTQVARQ